MKLSSFCVFWMLWCPCKLPVHYCQFFKLAFNYPLQLLTNIWTAWGVAPGMRFLLIDCLKFNADRSSFTFFSLFMLPHCPWHAAASCFSSVTSCKQYSAILASVLMSTGHFFLLHFINRPGVISLKYKTVSIPEGKITCYKSTETGWVVMKHVVKYLEINKWKIQYWRNQRGDK